MKLLRFVALAYTAIMTYAHNTTITKCTLCTLAVKQAEGFIASQGCNLLFDAEATVLCQAIGLGPEDPVSDLCIPILIKGCTIIEQNLEKHISDPKTTCTMLHLC